MSGTIGPRLGRQPRGETDRPAVPKVIPPGVASGSQARLEAMRADVNMLVWVNAKERTAVEFAELLGVGGFRLARIVPTDTAVSVIEALA